MYATNLQNNLVLLYREVFTDKNTDEYFESQHLWLEQISELFEMPRRDCSLL